MKTAVGIYKGEVFIAEDGNVNNGFGVNPASVGRDA